MSKLGTRTSIALAAAGICAIVLPASAGADFSSAYSQLESTGSTPCVVNSPTTVNTDTGLTSPNLGWSTPGPTVSNTVPINCTTITISSNLTAVGSKRLVMRASGDVTITGTLDVSASGATAGPGGGDGGKQASTAGGTGAGGPGGSSAFGGDGGTAGMSYLNNDLYVPSNGGAAGAAGSPSPSGDGGGGGGAGSGGGFSAGS